MSALAPFPADDPVWNTGGANRTTPLLAKQALGWDVGEEPPSSYFNWFMFYTGEYVAHYKTAVAALNDGKLDRDGGNTVTGNILPDSNVTRDLGSIAFRFDDVFADRVDTNTLTVNTTVGSGLIPTTTALYGLGTGANRWANVFGVAAAFDTLVVNTSALPDLPGGAFLGIRGTPFLSLVARDIEADDVRVYRFTQPSGIGDLAYLSSLATPLVVCKQTSTAASPTAVLSTSHLNVTTITHPFVGDYTVTFDVAINEDASVLVTTQSTGVTVAAAIAAGGGSMSVSLRNSITGAAVDGRFSVLIIGDHVVSSPVG